MKANTIYQKLACFYIQLIQDWISWPGGWFLSLRLSVCMSVRLSVQVNNIHNFRPVLMKMHSNDLNKNSRWHFLHFFKILFDDVITVILDVFRWGTIMVVIFKQFSLNWQNVFFYGWLCMGLQTSVLRHHLQGKMTVGKTVN